MTLTTGIDIISVHRVRALIEASGDRFVRRWFSSEEIAYCAQKAHPAEHYAARLAAKEAAVKALCPDRGERILLRDIDVVSLPSGAPRLRLSGRAASVAGERGIAEVYLSLSHCAEYAVASVIAVLRGA
jgi:holo-[acyl-carrier protein] synthase